MRIKRKAVYDAILLSAEQEFSENGYVKATIKKIAHRAGISSSNVYVYFQSKLEIAIAVYEPWFRRQITDLEQKVLDQKNIEQKLSCLLEGLWKTIPFNNKGLTTTLVQALAMANPQDRYNPVLLQWTEGKIAKMLKGIFDQESDYRLNFLPVAHMLMLTFDGVSLRHNLHQPVDRSKEMIAEMVEILTLKSLRI